MLREQLGLTGSKFGCGVGLCGACTVLVDDNPVRACATPVSSLDGGAILTIEGVAADPVGQRVQAAWLTEQVVQCGYCQSGQVLAATSLLKSKPSPSDADINTNMAGNVCRCGTYQRIRAAIHRAAGSGS